jgi:4-alpha-glucanotransferase
MAVWWRTASEIDRQQVSELQTVKRITGGTDLTDLPYDPIVRDALIEALFASNAGLLLLPVQDVFGWSDRINQPATVTDANWSFRLPWPIDRSEDIPAACERQVSLRRWSTRYQRL